MALDFTTNPGGLFPRLGRILHVAYIDDVYQATLPAAFSAIDDQFESSLQDVGGAVMLQADVLARVSSGVMAFAQQAAQATVVKMVQFDSPATSQSRSVKSTIEEIIRQMKAGGVTVKANVITVTPTILTGSVGTGALVTSTKRGDGLVQENTIVETLRLVCVDDSYAGNATAGQEKFGLAGAPITAGIWDYDAVTVSGSGAATPYTVVSPDVDASTSTNLLTNSNFELWTGSPAAANNWTLEVGSWGTSIEQSLTSFRGTYAVQFNPGATLNALYQEFDNDDQTVVAPTALTSYAVNVWLRKLSGTITGGILTVELVDDSGTVTNDMQGNPNSFTVTLSTLTTSYVAYNSVFRLNSTPPAIVRLRFRVSTALAGASFLLDDAAFAPLAPMYTGGPGFAIFTGSTYFAINDGWSIVNTNDYGGASFGATFQTGFQRLFDMRAQGLLLPSASPGTIANTLITS